jgi:ATP synthase protein I
MSEPDRGFEDRLRAAEDRQKPSAPSGSAGDTTGSALGPGSALGTGLRVGIELVSALAVSVGIGWLLDHWLHTTPVFIGVFVLLGGAAGVMNVYRVMGPRK